MFKQELRYKEFLALQNVSFTLERGDRLAILGMNGAGKTTTMNIITGFIPPTSGTVTVEGFDIMNNPQEVKKRIGYLPEQPPVYTDLTVREYLNFVAKLKKVPADRVKEHVDMAIESVKLQKVAKRLIGNLSKGYRQRVGFAQALVGQPKILILDEPTVGLDPTQIIEIRKLISDLKKKHTIIFSSHILSEVSAVANRVVIIDGGKIVAEGDTKSLSRSLGGKNLQVSVLGPKSSALSAIKTVYGVKSVDWLEERNGINTFAIEQADGEDVRKALFYEMTRQSFPIYGLKSLDDNLEDVFLEIVKRGGVRGGNP